MTKALKMVEKKHYYCGHSAKHFCTKWCIVGCHLIYCHVSLKQNYEKLKKPLCNVQFIISMIFLKKCNIQGCSSWRNFSIVKIYCGLTFISSFLSGFPFYLQNFLIQFLNWQDMASFFPLPSCHVNPLFSLDFTIFQTCVRSNFKVP